jgi:DNA modification methylase
VTYEQFLAAKCAVSQLRGFEVSREEINPELKPHTRDIVQWALRRGCAAIFSPFGMHKTATQLEIMRVIGYKDPGLRLIICPLGVRHQFFRDAEERFHGNYSLKLKFIRRISEVEDERTIYLSNFESVREGILDVEKFQRLSLDEADVLRGFGGTKTFREFMKHFENRGKYKFAATATPSPNEYEELLAYAAFLDVMDVGQAKTRFFKRDSTKADKLTIHPHKEAEWWYWISSWAILVQKPSDLGYSDEGYVLPELDIHWHELPTNHQQAGYETSGQARLVKKSNLSSIDAAREKRESLDARIAKMMDLRALDRGAHRIIWHDLEDERRAIEKAIPASVSVYGSQRIELNEAAISDFTDGKIQELNAKPQMSGSGNNFQYHCAWEIFLGIGYKFKDFIQAVHRCYRFGQQHKVRLDLIYTEAERGVRTELERKWEQHKQFTEHMAEIIREYGLAANALQKELSRSIGVERRVETGERFELVNDDAVHDTRGRQRDSIHLILTSIPFSNQYEYTPSYNDFGHTDSPAHFFQQMEFLTPELFRMLKPGRLAAIHVKDRIVPGGLTGLGFQTVNPFHADCIAHYTKHGFAYLGMKTIVTDVVRENNQTYRLGWSEQCKDGSRMGVGMPEYLLLFRKPPTDSSNGYADEPVLKNKANYSRSRWQIDAHGFARSSGNRLLMPEDLDGVPHERMFKMFREYSLSQVYSFEQHVKLSEALERCPDCGHIHTGKKSCSKVCDCKKSGGRLPVTFMLLQPQSWSKDVWTDITRMRTLNGSQYAAGREMHLCPMQLDLVDRAITQYTMPGETVYDPFAGIGTVPSRAVALGRVGKGCELNPRYWVDGVGYCKAAEAKASVPTLFDLEEISA